MTKTTERGTRLLSSARVPSIINLEIDADVTKYRFFFRWYPRQLTNPLNHRLQLFLVNWFFFPLEMNSFHFRGSQLSLGETHSSSYCSSYCYFTRNYRLLSLYLSYFFSSRLGAGVGKSGAVYDFHFSWS